MNPALWISKTGLDAQQTNISVTSNNLANASTVGYKKARAIFEDLLYQNINQPGGRSSADTELPSGLMATASSPSMTRAPSSPRATATRCSRRSRSPRMPRA